MKIKIKIIPPIIICLIILFIIFGYLFLNSYISNNQKKLKLTERKIKSGKLTQQQYLQSKTVLKKI